VPLWLDHASISVPDLRAAVERLDAELGLTATVSLAAPERHSRVHLDRTYLEVAADAGRVGWQATMCFLRFADPEALRAHLDATGLTYAFGVWEGVDGTWDDVEVRSGDMQVPTLIRRTAPVDIARDWPPALSGSHRCGARSLVAVHLEVSSLDAATRAFSTLVGTTLSPAPGDAAVRVPLASGALVLREGADDRIAGIVLGVGSLVETRRVLPLGPTEDGVAWLEGDGARGLQLGFSALATATSSHDPS
jgi:hypothetical protein